MPVEDVEKMIRKEPLEDFYDVGSELGRGKFAIVKRCTAKTTGVQYAVKVLKKRRRGKSCREEILVEIDIMRQSGSTDHVRIVKLYEVFESGHEFHLVIELATGGELFRKIAIDPLPEEKAREVVYQILDGVQHLHTLNIVHLDLKPENILLCKKNHLDIKIADFGLAVQLRKGQEMRTLVGTAEYVAPEILNFEPLSTFSDMWSIGALTYALLTGYSPFQGETHQETFLNVSTVDYDFDDEVFEVVSQDAKDFVEKLLIKQPNKRLTAPTCIQHPWMLQRKSNNLNSSTSSLDSALCMDSASSMEPSPVSSASSSFSPAPSTTTYIRSSSSSNPTAAAVAAATTTNPPFSQPEDMRKVNEKLTQISTLATDRLIAEAPSKPRAEDSPTSTDSSTSTLREDESIENIAALVAGPQKDGENQLSSSLSKMDSLKDKERPNEVTDGSLSASFSWTRPKLTVDTAPPEAHRIKEPAAGDDKQPMVKVSTPKDITPSSIARESLKRYKESLLAEKTPRGSLEGFGGRDSAFSRGLGRDLSSTRGNRSMERNDKLSSKSSSSIDRSYSLSTNKTSASSISSSSTLYEEGEKSKFYSRLATKDITSLDLKTVTGLEKYQRIKKAHHARPHTPEPETLPISEAKIQQCTEHRTRRKSEGMSPAHKQQQGGGGGGSRPLRSSQPSEATVPEEAEEEEEKLATNGTGRSGSNTPNGESGKEGSKSPTKMEPKSTNKNSTSLPTAGKYISPSSSPELKNTSDSAGNKRAASPTAKPQAPAEDKQHTANERLIKPASTAETKSRTVEKKARENDKSKSKADSKEPVSKTRGRFFEASSEAWQKKAAPAVKEEPGSPQKSPEAVRNSIESKTCRLASPDRSCRLGSPDRLAANARLRREKSPVSDRMKQVKSNRRRTPVISTEALNDILAGNIPDVDDDAVIGFPNATPTTSSSSSQQPGNTTHEEDTGPAHSAPLQTWEEEEEDRSNSPPQDKPSSKASSPTSPASPVRRERKGALKSRSPTSPTSPDRKVSPERKVVTIDPSLEIVVTESAGGTTNQRKKKPLLSASQKSKSLSSASPERDLLSPPSDYDKTHFDPFTSSADRHGNAGGSLGRLRANSLVMSRSTPDLSQLLGEGKREAKAKKVGRSNSRRLLGKSRLDSYVTGGSNQHHGGSASLSTSSKPPSSVKTLPGRFLSGSAINKAFSSFRSRDSGRDKSDSYSSNRKY